MSDWRARLRVDPLPALLFSGDAALVYFTHRDLLGEDPGLIEQLWKLTGAQKILIKQQADGSWPRAGEHKHPAINYGLIETWRWLRVLVEQFGFTRQHPAVERAAEFIFSCQTEEGDFRGILANQYATYYSGAILSLLVQAGYADDPRVERCFQWLLGMRQVDGGWSIPMITHKLDRATQYRLSSEVAEPIQPDRSKPFSHNATGMILRAFAVHPQYRHCAAARTAARLLAGRFFQPDAYTSYQAASYWLRFEYPFWWNNLVAALDSISRIGPPGAHAQVKLALDWLVEHQESSGLWKTSYAKPDEAEKDNLKMRGMKPWISLAICRVLRRYWG